ncbi:hypothetical protein H8E06_00095 [bacterium]|nr:hypothetical protein [bacterium]
MIIKLAKDASIGARRRMRRHGDDVELVLEHFYKGEPASFGLLFKSNKTGKYIWYGRRQLEPIDFYEGDAIPELQEGISTYTPNKELLYEYLDHLMNNVLSKRDQKKYGPLYEKIKNNEMSLVERFSS